MRGNPKHLDTTAQPIGSIPACAGEPILERMEVHDEAVYPRVCGGTHGLPMNPPRRPGLSPRVRGNPPKSRIRSRCIGSIPACAGEPRPLIRNPPALRVYPRVCGGT